MAKGWRVARSCCTLVRRQWEGLIDQVDGEEVDSFVVECGKPGPSCSGGYMGCSDVRGAGIFVIGRS